MENPSDPLQQEEMRIGSTLQGPDGTKIENGESERKTQANVQERLQYLHTMYLTSTCCYSNHREKNPFCKHEKCDLKDVNCTYRFKELTNCSIPSTLSLQVVFEIDASSQ